MSDAELVDAYIAVRDKRLEADKIAADLKTQETELKTRIIHKLQDSHLTAIGSESGILSLTCKQKPQATDWTLVYEFIRERNAFELLHKRLTEGAFQEYWNDGIVVPGVVLVDVYDVTISKSKVKNGKV